MPKRPRLYQRLTRPHTGVGSYSSLWLGPDHLLEVDSTGVTETYRRYYFRDIRGFFVTHTDVYLYTNIAAGILTFVGGIPVVTAIYNQVSAGGASGGWGWLFLLVPAFFVLAVNLVKGPSRRVHVITALQQARLRSLSRARKLRKVMARIEPLIREAQANLAPGAAPPPSAPSAQSFPPPLS